MEILPTFCEDLFIMYLHIPIPSPPRKKSKPFSSKKEFCWLTKTTSPTQSNLVWRHIKHLWSIKWLTHEKHRGQSHSRENWKGVKREIPIFTFVYISFWKSFKENSWISCQYRINQPSKLSVGHSAMRLGWKWIFQTISTSSFFYIHMCWKMAFGGW